MAAIVWQNIVDDVPAPELATFAPGAQIVLLEHANTKLVVSGLDGEDGNKTRLARMYWVAHAATMIKRKGATGARSSQSAGGVSESFAVPNLPWLGLYAQTSYGQLYAMILGSSAHRAGLLLSRAVVTSSGGAGSRGGSGA